VAKYGGAIAYISLFELDITNNVKMINN